MNNPTNSILMKVANLTKTSGVIANVTDKLLSYVLPEEDAAAACHYSCGYCQRISRYVGQKKCKKCCTKRPCITYWENCNPGV